MSIPSICRTATTQDAAASPSVAVSTAAVAVVLALVTAATRNRSGLPASSVSFHELSQPDEGIVPLLGHVLEKLVRIEQRLLFELPYTFPTAVNAVREAGLREYQQVFAHRLATDRGSSRQLRDGERPLAAQPCDETQSRLVTQCCENRCSRCVPPPATGNLTAML
jgi:hypothetical protein